MKAILVIDMPANCMQCRFRDSEWCSVEDCAKNDGSLVIYRDIHNFKRHEGCPLKPIPKYYPSTSNPQRIEYLKKLGMTKKEQYYYELGHDDCIDEILGEEE